MTKINLYLLTLLLGLLSCDKNTAQPNVELENTEILYVMPEETEEHEGTWLQWPHNYNYGGEYKEEIQSVWVEMTRGLIKDENVHIIAYNESEKAEIISFLTSENISLDRVDFFLYETDDFWVRDNGPIFVFDKNDNLMITDWGFNGWGEKMKYTKCDIIPDKVSTDIEIARIDLSSVVLEGGSVEIDGNGTFMATRSSITNENRNPNLTEDEIEIKLKENLGVSHFIWLDGVYGSDDITDYHIDGFAKFHDSETIVCLNESDLTSWGVTRSDRNTLLEATNKDGEIYNYVYLPLTQDNVVTKWGKDIGYGGSYVNYYVGNKVVLVPNYNDPNDNTANAIIQNLFPEREVIGIDVRNLYYGGGMIHCITQQQPKTRN